MDGVTVDRNTTEHWDFYHAFKTLFRCKHPRFSSKLREHEGRVRWCDNRRQLPINTKRTPATCTRDELRTGVKHFLELLRLQASAVARLQVSASTHEVGIYLT